MNLKEQLDAIEEEYKQLEEQQKDLMRRRNEVLKASMEADPEHKVMRDALANMLIVDPDTDPFGRPKRSKLEPLNWLVDRFYYTETEAFKPGWSAETGSWVAVRPVGEKYEGKTFLGIYLGDCALSVSARYDLKTKAINFKPSYHNPAIYVPDLKEIIYGSASWWSEIKSPEALRKISDADIQSVWYVKALKEMGGE